MTALRVFGDLVIYHIIGVALARGDRVEGADADAAAAAGADVVVDGRLVILDRDGVMRAVAAAGPAADAQGRIHIGLAVGMHFHLARARARAHADVFERAAHAG